MQDQLEFVLTTASVVLRPTVHSRLVVEDEGASLATHNGHIYRPRFNYLRRFHTR